MVESFYFVYFLVGRLKYLHQKSTFMTFGEEKTVSLPLFFTQMSGILPRKGLVSVQITPPFLFCRSRKCTRYTYSKENKAHDSRSTIRCRYRRWWHRWSLGCFTLAGTYACSTDHKRATRRK